MTKQQVQPNTNAADVSENDLRERYPEALEVLLRDHTTGKNIFWATDNYVELGEGFDYKDEIKPAGITGEYGRVIRPRVQKDKELQTSRVRDMAEVFTPSWICNAQINLVDNAWFGYDWAFNKEINTADGVHAWEVTTEPIKFPEGKKKIIERGNVTSTVSSIISRDTPFGVSTKPTGSKKKTFELFEKKRSKDYIALYYIEKIVRKKAYVKRSAITKNAAAIDSYKVFIPEASGSGSDPIVLGIPEYAPPPSICSQSYLYVAFTDENAAKNFIAYLKTKFFRVIRTI